MAFNEHVILPKDRITDPHVARIVDRLRRQLGDNHPDQYLFAAKREIWEDSELYWFLEDELDNINVETPHTEWNLWNMPDRIIGLLLQGAKIIALMNKVIKENNEFMQYSDNGLALTMNKNQQYLSSMQAIFSAHEQRRKHIKQTFRPAFVGIGKQRIPFNMARPLGMLPNLKHTFGVQ